MPHKFVLASSLESIESRFHVALSASAKVLPASYSISGGEVTYVITMENPNELQAFQFGITPYWARKPMDLINARAEGDKNPHNDPTYSGPNQIFLKKAFLKPLQSQRCLVLADAYYEWSSAKKPYLVYLQYPPARQVLQGRDGYLALSESELNHSGEECFIWGW